MKKIIILFTLFTLFTLSIGAFSQDFIANLTSNFIFRGKMISDKINVQPIMYFSKGDTILTNEIGTFSSFSLDGSYKEVDLYYKFTYKWIYLTITDYMFDINRFLNYSNTSTNVIETTLGFKSNSFPIVISLNSFIWGNDKDINNKQLYSSYAEACYAFKNVNLFCGITPYKSFYANKPAIVNVGISMIKNLVIEKLSIPITTSIVINPDVKQIFANLTFIF